MSAVLTISSDAPFSRRKRWTADECDQLERQGFLPSRYELLDGEIVEKMSQHLPHTFGVNELLFFMRGITQRDQLTNQATIIVAPEDAPHNRPEPDIGVLRRPGLPRGAGFPHAADFSLVAEVSDTTLTDDLGYKASLYARANLPEYWVLDINGRRLIVHLLPVNGRYSSITEYDELSRVAPAFAPQHSVLVGDLL